MKEHDRVVLLKDVTEEGLKAGDVGAVVHVYRQEEVYVRTVSNKDITHVRELIAT